MPLSSGFYPTEIQGRLRPPAQIEQWNIARPNPSGLRHWESGVYKPSAKGTTRLAADGLRGGFQAQLESGVAIDFGKANVDNNGFYSNTICLTFNLGEINTHPDSFFNLATGVDTWFKAFNIKFWVNEISALSGICGGSGTPTFYYLTSADWRRNLKLRSTTTGAQVVPSSLPSSQNLFSKGESTVFVSGVYTEQEFSHFLYIVGKFPSGCNYPLGTYGGSGQGTFTWRFTYDWTNITAAVRSTDDN